VVAERATTVVMPQRSMAALVAYLHNNPVRAGVVSAPGDTDWTSHRAWTGEMASSKWLAVDVGLAVAGFGGDEAGRASFDRFVRERSGQPRDPQISGAALRTARARVRDATALPFELSAMRLDDSACRAEVVNRGAPRVETRWNGDLREVVAAAAHYGGCAIERVLSRSRARVVVEARRIVVVAAVWLLRRRICDVAAALALSESAASQLQRRGERVLPTALRVAAEVRAGRWILRSLSSHG
jgi:hypothetical protein